MADPSLQSITERADEYKNDVNYMGLSIIKCDTTEWSYKCIPLLTHQPASAAAPLQQSWERDERKLSAKKINDLCVSSY